MNLLVEAIYKIVNYCKIYNDNIYKTQFNHVLKELESYDFAKHNINKYGKIRYSYYRDKCGVVEHIPLNLKMYLYKQQCHESYYMTMPKTKYIIPLLEQLPIPTPEEILYNHRLYN